MSTKATRPISWVKGARKDFQTFPVGAQEVLLAALTAVAEGAHPDLAKPLHGLGSGVLEVALQHRGNAFRVVYAVQIDTDVWVLHAFQKKSTRRIATPKTDVDLVRDRLKRLKDLLR